MVRGSVREEDLRLTAEYLGVEAAASRVIVYLADAPHEVELRDEESIAERVAHALRVEVLGTRGSEGTILLVEAPAEIGSAMMVARVKHAMAQVLAEFGELGTIVGVSGVARPDALTRAYREAREVALCVDRFAHGGTPVISVDDLGPARLFIANGDPASVRRYVRDVLGPLLTGAPGTPDLLRTVQSFFDTGRSVRASAALLGIHENTVRLRLAKVHDLTGLDVAADPTDQLSVQTALLVLRLEGHSALPAFEDTHTDEQQETA
jgi:sugar diacid utilization regulator